MDLSDARQRFTALIADHDRIAEDYRRLEPLWGEDRDFDNPPPPLMEWFEWFTEVSNRMFTLAHDLGIPFDSDKATAEEYVRVWGQVKELMAQDGNRRLSHGPR